jgi:Tfp pilus assembly protein PilV
VRRQAREGRTRRRATSAHGERGTILIETLIATALLLMVVSGLMNAFLVVVAQNYAQGQIGTRTTESGQDKMESLMALDFSNASLGGAMAASATIGSIPPAAVVSTYVDYLDASGNAATATTAEYTRQWTISTDATATLKTITVVATGKVPKGSFGLAPATKVVCVKSSGL